MECNVKLKDQLSQFQQPLYSPFDEKTGQGLERPEPTAAELDEYYAPGRDADHEYGVVFRADYETVDDGMCRQARLHARALAGHAPLLLTSINHRVRVGGQVLRVYGDDTLPAQVLHEVGPLRNTRMRTAAVTVWHTLLKSAAQLKDLLVPQYVRSQIGGVERALAGAVVYTPWERDRVHEDLVAVLNRVGQVWLQCERNRTAFVESGVKPERIRLVPNAYELVGPAKLPETDPRMPRGRRYYNIGKWEPRKAQHELIGAFLLAHRPGEPAHLTIKTSQFGNWRGYPLPDESLRFWGENQRVRERGWRPEFIERHIAVYDRYFSEAQMTWLHALHNVYVSASHAEGWDYPAFDAVSAGNQLVYVPFGGAEDFGTGGVAVPTQLGPVPKQYEWEPNARWAVYELQDLCDAMVGAEIPRRRVAPAGLYERFGAPVAGRRMAGLLKELLEEMRPEIATQLFQEAL